jgi:hypothetical protein
LAASLYTCSLRLLPPHCSLVLLLILPILSAGAAQQGS